MVYVLNKDGEALMPTERHGHVRRLLKQGKAKAKHKKPFTIQLLYDTPDKVQPVILGIDPGRTNIGACAVITNGTPLFSAEVKTRNKEIPKLMEQRKNYRKAHRCHRREKRQRRAKANGTTVEGGTLERHLPGYGEDKTILCKEIKNKEARFSNRKRPEGWLTPTANQLLQTHVNLVHKVGRFLPVSQIILELNKFAFMRLDDPSVQGRMFQEGPLKGYEGSVKAAVYEIQKGKCLLCEEPIKTYHHVRERHKNGSETVRNRVGLCACCHRSVHTDPAYEAKLQTKAKGLRKQYDALGVLNQIIPYLIDQLKEEYQVSYTTGWKTKEFREGHGLTKEHFLDAYAIACSSLGEITIQEPGTCYRIRQFRRHDRKACEREMFDRKYIRDGKTVAVNRHKAMGQTSDSLKDYIVNGGRTDQLSVRHGKKAMKDMSRHYPGCKTGKKTLLKRASGYYWFDDGMKTSVKKTIITLHNAGLVFVSNMAM